jgi:predicted ATPase
MNAFFSSIRFYALEPDAIARPVPLERNIELQRNGKNLAGVLDNLRDTDEESFEAMKAELRSWLPEFDRLGFDTHQGTVRSFKLRQAISKQMIPSEDLSDGTLIALALLAIAYNPNPPSLVCLEEPDRGLHPRLLRDVRDALYRLSYPEQFKLARKPVQVIATTHSPYFVDLFKDHPEEIIVAEKNSDGTASFKSLAEDEKLRELIGEAPLGEVWYSGVLGGVPAAK